jgi:hypothetical protein
VRPTPVIVLLLATGFPQSGSQAPPATLRPMAAHDAEMDAIAAELEAAGILTVTTEDDGATVERGGADTRRSPPRCGTGLSC